MTKPKAKALAVPGRKAAPRYVVGPEGEPLSAADLPPSNTTRWVTRRKAEVVLAVRGGLITLQEALTRWSISDEEFRNWSTLLDKHGRPGMRTTRIQDYQR